MVKSPMTRKERTQQNRFDTKIAPLVAELSKLCKKFGMPMLTSVQLFENEDTGARVNTEATHPLEMSLPMQISTSLLNGTTKVKIEDDKLQIIMPKAEMPSELTQYAYESTSEGLRRPDKEELETLAEHAAHCEDCRLLMDEMLDSGESIDNILVPQHEEMGLMDLLEDLRKSKIPFILPKNNIIH